MIQSILDTNPTGLGNKHAKQNSVPNDSKTKYDWDYGFIAIQFFDINKSIDFDPGAACGLF